MSTGKAFFIHLECCPAEAAVYEKPFVRLLFHVRGAEIEAQARSIFINSPNRSRIE